MLITSDNLVIHVFRDMNTRIRRKREIQNEVQKNLEIGKSPSMQKSDWICFISFPGSRGPQQMSWPLTHNCYKCSHILIGP
jgi:hypothetical protein